MSLQYSRKYERVKKNPRLLPKPMLISLPPQASVTTVITKSEDVILEDEAIDNDESTKTYVQSSNEDGDIILEEVQYDGDTNYVNYAVNMDELNGNFSSTTIVNGTTISLSELQFGGSTDSVLVMPLDSLDVPMVSDDNGIRTIDVGDYDIKPESKILREAKFIPPADSTEDIIVRNPQPMPKYKNKPTWLTARLPKPPKQTTAQTKLYFEEKNTITYLGGGKRGLIRFGRSRMIADSHTTIAVADFKNQLTDTSDVVGRLDLAPSTKSMMHFLNTKGVNKLFANPGRRLGAKIQRGFLRHLTIKQTEVEVTYNDMPLLPVGFTPTIDPKSIKRITRKRRYPEAEEYQRKMCDAEHLRVEELTDEPEFEEVIIPDCKDSVILLSNMESTNRSTMDDEGNIYTDDFNPHIVTIEEEQELDSFPFEDTLEESTEFSAGQEFDPGDGYAEEDEYSDVNQFHENKATIIMIENENGTRENVQVLLSAPEQCSISGDGETQVIFCEESDDDKDIMIVPDEPMCESITETVMTS